MKIFYLFPRSGNALVPMANTWRCNVLPALRELGHEVVEYYEPTLEELAGIRSLDQAWVQQNQWNFVARVLRALEFSHRQKPFDLFLSYLWEPLFTREALKHIRDLSIPTVNFFCNYYNAFDRIVTLAPWFDFNWVSDRGAIPLYRQIGATAIFLPMAANPQVYHPHEVPREFPVTFVGGRYGNRSEHIAYLLEQNIPVRVWGPGWQGPTEAGLVMSTGLRHMWQRLFRRLSTRGGTRFVWNRLYEQLHARVSKKRLRQEKELAAVAGPPLSDDELIQMYSRSQISLGFSVVGSSHLERSPVTQIRLRDFEAPMSGAFYVTEYGVGIEELYDLDREIVVFRSKEELADLVRFYLLHPDEAQKIRTAGRKRALRQHTWQHRFRELFREVGLSSDVRAGVSLAR